MTAAACAHCQLPVPEAGPEPRYCCSGCRFMAGVVRQATDDASEDQREAAWLLARLILCALLAVIVMMFSLILYAEEVLPQARIGPEAPEQALALRGLIRLLLLAATAPILTLLGRPLWDDILRAPSWRERATESLILSGAAAAFALSAVNTFIDGPQVYFETTAGVLVLVTLGRFLDAHAKSRAARSLSQLTASTPSRALRLGRAGAPDVAEPEELAVEALELGDRILARPGATLPVDGRILRGQSELDESAVTGEFEAAPRGPGERVFAGTHNLTGALVIEVVEGLGDRVIDRIEALIREAWAQPGRRVELAQSLARALLPLALALALGAGLWHGLAEGSAVRALQVGLSVILIACPCALGLATPLALWVGLGRCARAGVLLRSGAALETLGRAERVLLDKTGTLTCASLTLIADAAPGEPEALSIARALAAASDHPLSQALARWARERGIAPAPDLEVREQAGAGLEAELAGRRWRLGRPGFAIPEADEASLILSCDGAARARWRVEETLAPGAEEGLRALAALGLQPAILSGDRPERVAALGARLGIPAEGACDPEMKARKISRIAEEAVVVMLGDGLNDAPALAAAGVGLAVVGGVDVSRQVADGLVFGGSALGLARAVEAAREARARIWGNLLWASGFNAIGLWLAVSGSLNPVWAAVAMAASSAAILSVSWPGGGEPDVVTHERIEEEPGGAPQGEAGLALQARSSLPTQPQAA